MLEILKSLKERVYFYRLFRKPKRKVSLLIKCVMGFLVVQAIVMFVLAYRAMNTLTDLRAFLLKENKIQVEALSKLLSTTALPAIFNNDFRILQKQANEAVLEKRNETIRLVRIFDVEGKVVAKQEKLDIGREQHWVYSRPIIYNGVNFGRVEVHSSLKSIYSKMEGLFYFWSIVFVASTIITSFLISAIIYFLLFIPLEIFTEKMKRVEKGDLAERIDITTGDELSGLAKHFDQMTGALQKRVEDVSKARDQLRFLFDQLGVALASTLDLKKLAKVTLTIAADTLRASTGVFMLLDPSRNELDVKAALGQGADKRHQLKIKVGEGVAGWVAKNASPLLIPDCSDPGMVHLSPAEDGGKHSLMSAPLLSRGRVLGVLSVYSEEQTYSEKDLEALHWLVNQAAVAVDNVQLYQETEKLAHVDSLTQLYNHHYFLEKLESEFKRAERFSHFLTCLMIDIDDFKDFNDTYGHLFGDLILKEVGLTIKKNIREIDICARYGGEEFTILLPETGKSLGTVVAERIRNAFESSQFLVGEKKIPIHLTVTIGVAIYPEDAQTPDDLIRRSDVAMYVGKRTGKNKVITTRDASTHAT